MDFCEFKASMVYLASSRTAGAFTQRSLVLGVGEKRLYKIKTYYWVDGLPAKP